MTTKFVLDAARRLVDYFDYHNNNLRRGQEERYLKLKDEIERYDRWNDAKRQKMDK